MKISAPGLARKTAVCILALQMQMQDSIAQDYTPFVHQPELLVQPKKNATSRHEANLAQVTGEYKKEITEEFRKRFEHIGKFYTTKQLITDPEAVEYLQQLANRIFSANPRLAKLPVSIHFYRAYWPNAASYGEGTIVFNTSLFSRLRNESQAAFILCHELAHYYLDHSNRNIREYVNTVNSASFKQELKAIEKTTYQRNKRADQLLKSISYNNRRHSRLNETEADSLALELLQPTGYDVREAITCLALLDSIDKDKHSGELALKQQFHFQGYPFRARWTKTSAPSLSEAMSAKDNKENHEEDSLKTHPDCKKRIGAITAKVNAAYQPSQRLFIVNQQYFDRLRERLDADLVAYCLDAEETGRAMYYALQLLHRQPGNAWLATTVGRCLNILYSAQRTHTLGKMIDIPGHSPDSEYEEYLRFLQRLRLDEIASISHHFMQQHASAFKNDEAFKKVQAESQLIYAQTNNP